MAFSLTKFKRTLVLALLARQTPAKLAAVSRKRLQKAFARAARISPAYRALLAEAGVAPGTKLAADEILQRAPVLEKADLFERFPIHELVASTVAPASLAGVLTSSGHGGSNFAFGLSTRAQLAFTPADIDMGLQGAFDIDGRSTLLVNCLPMGVVFTSNTVCVANVSVREDMALAILRQAGPLFEQVILCVDPLFCKRLLDYAAEQAFDWSALRTHVILGEEMFSEEFRSYLARRLGADIDTPGGVLIGSSMGVGELGLNLFFETAETIALRRERHWQQPDALLPAFFCYNPLRTFVEVLEPDDDGVGDLVVTMLDNLAPVPMIRYKTGDRARWVPDAELRSLPSELYLALYRQPLPMVAIVGRDRDRIGEHWHVDHFKALLYRDAALADHLSGAFRVLPGADGPALHIQLGRNCVQAPAEMAVELSALMAASARERGAPAPALRCFAYADFPHGMSLDYERKFRYLPAADEVSAHV
ncbi:hypothetical protein CWI75_14805 [Kineobactrum sediminis]|uniref:CoF synthetase n=1 Tax=Kineobactrum sediminis TaxID=1905677 RepID=A0A2N5XZD7_9GAMM|nr:hypothetical protein [Kineobactrum sediminis]PLW81504.1 hypothetical protein CWI75_14805 [Kineobactrum sediminis]